MAESKLLIAIVAMVSVVEPALLDSDRRTELFTQFMLAPPGSFATPPEPNSGKIISNSPDDVSFLLYSSPSDPDKYEEITYLDAASASKLNKSKPVKFLVHGFVQNATTICPRAIKDAYLEIFGEACRVIVVDWSKLSTPNIVLPGGFLYYTWAAKNVETAGDRLGKFAAWLESLDKLDRKTTHIVGHSLGAHVAAWAGVTFLNTTGYKLGRLSGLDPAGPLFGHISPLLTINSTQADYVDCYHTNIGVLGTAENTGSADFRINKGGPIQPRCLPDIGGFCSHERSCEYWRKSILNSMRAGGSTQYACRPSKLLPNRPSNNCQTVRVGDSATSETQGQYFV